MEVEVSFDPTNIYFRDMKKGEERTQRVHLKNTANSLLLISSIDPGDDMILVDLINRTPDWPLELKQDETLDILVSYQYKEDKPRVSSQITVNYKGGEGNVAHLRFRATLKIEPKEPPKRTKPLPEKLNQHEDTKPESVKPSPSKKDFPMPPPPPNMPLKKETIKSQDKAPE